MGDGAGADHARAAAALAALGIAPDPALVERVVAFEAIDSPHLGDLALAFACGHQNAAALAEFERRYGGDFPGALSRLALGRAEIDEVAQTVRERLFVPRPDSPPKILDYAGRGALAGWLRAVIVRAGIDSRRRHANDPELSGDGEPLIDLHHPATDDPELESLRARYAEPFRLAFRDAVRLLPQDERNALRLNVAEGLNIEQIGVVYGVHRATVARWIAHAKEAIAATTRKLLGERLGIPAQDIESLVRLCQSRLDVGFSDFTVTAPTNPDRRR